jgi:hypothetical protein
MNRAEVEALLKEVSPDVDENKNDRIASVLNKLINAIETLTEQNVQSQEEIQKLKDEINRLKGEDEKPNIRPQTKDSTNHSSEKERKKREPKKKRKPKRKKKETVKVNRQVTCEIDKNSLPDDAQFKGYETRIFQDLKIELDNVEFKLPVYYSPSLKKTFIGKLPEGYYGEFGPGIRTLVIASYRDFGMTEPAIERFLKTFNIQISRSTISRMLTEDHDIFHEEKEDIIIAGLKASSCQHIDDTGCRVNGKNHYAHILCNDYFTSYFTRQRKDRLTLLDILCRGNLKFDLNEESFSLMSQLGLPLKCLNELKAIGREGRLTQAEMEDVLLHLFPHLQKKKKNRQTVLESAAFVYYCQSEWFIEYLMCDDAPQFNKLSRFKALCWIHEGRHYKKLDPVFPSYRKLLDDFLEKFWDFYTKLQSYKLDPSKEKAERLDKEFDELFSTKSNYAALDARKTKTLAKKDSLLLVLKFPFLPLHNNSAELGARTQARIRDINLQTVSPNGTKTKDTFATIVQTSKKLGVNVYSYLYDRISKKFEMPSLAHLIFEQSNLPPNTL